MTIVMRFHTRLMADRIAEELQGITQKEFRSGNSFFARGVPIYLVDAATPREAAAIREIAQGLYNFIIATALPSRKKEPQAHAARPSKRRKLRVPR